MMEEDNKDYKIFLNGDNKGFENLVLRYKNLLIYFIERYVKNLNIAEDIAQDVFVEIFVHKGSYTQKSSFKTYLFSIGRNKAVDWIRKEQKIDFFAEIPRSEEFESLEAQIIKKEEIRALSRSLERLRPEYQEVILLVDFEEFTYKEAARVLKKTLPQVKVLLHRARKSLRVQIERSESYEK